MHSCTAMAMSVFSFSLLAAAPSIHLQGWAVAAMCLRHFLQSLSPPYWLAWAYDQIQTPDQPGWWSWRRVDVCTLHIHPAGSLGGALRTYFWLQKDDSGGSYQWSTRNAQRRARGGWDVHVFLNWTVKGTWSWEWWWWARASFLPLDSLVGPDESIRVIVGAIGGGFLTGHTNYRC